MSFSAFPLSILCGIRNRQYTLLLFLAVFCFPTNAGAKEIVTLVSDLWCPYICQSAKQPGYIVEVLQQIFKDADIELQYHIQDWEEAIVQARSGAYSMAGPAARNEAPGFIFGHGFVGIAKGAFFTSRDSSWRYTGLSSLRGIRMGVVSGYSYGWVVDGVLKRSEELGVQVYSANGDAALLDNLKKLARGELDAVVGTTAVVTYTARQNGISDQIIVAGEALYRIPVFMAFSPADIQAKRNARLVDEGLVRLRKSGKLAEILGYYGLSDWGAER